MSKTFFWQEAVQHYCKRLAPWRSIEITELKDAPASLSISDRIADEGKRLLSSLRPNDLAVVLDNKGLKLDSLQFAKLLGEFENTKCPCFIIGGAFGLSEAVKAKAWKLISLSNLTFTHELARCLLLEQIYRAQTIIQNIPYHH